MYTEKFDDDDDPLNVLWTWTYSIRAKVAKALEPLCYLIRPPDETDYPGEVIFYAPVNAELKNKILELAYAVQYEVGLREDGRISQEKAEQLAQEIEMTAPQ